MADTLLGSALPFEQTVYWNILIVSGGLAMYVMYRNRQYFKYPNDVPSMVSMMEKYMFVVACILAVLPLYILS
jgi:hypothetical protein